MYICVAPNSLVVDALFSVLASREACKSAKVPCLSARVFESSARFAAESFTLVECNKFKAFQTLVYCVSVFVCLYLSNWELRCFVYCFVLKL